MVYAFSAEQTAAYAKAALLSLQQHGIPPTPPNYAVWFEYHSGGNPDLCKAVDAAIAAGGPMTDAMHSDIYDKFFSSRAELEAYRETSRRVQETLGDVLKAVDDASDGASRYRLALRDISSEIVAKPGSIAELIGKLVQETREMEQRNRTLETQLTSSSKVIDNLRQNLDDIRHDALTDSLTGIANRRLFELTLQEAGLRAAQSGDSLSVLIVDVDHFKIFNDTWGHQIGDEVLKFIAQTLKSNVKGQDLPARYGGDEFAVVLPNSSIDAAEAVGNNIRRAFEKHRLSVKNTGMKMSPITVSIGAASYRSGEAIADLIRRADTALYQAKHAGRNKVMLDETSPGSRH